MSDDIPQPKSRSQVKREMKALQALGERLTELSQDQLKRIEMPQELYESVLFAQSLTKHGAKRRQMQHIGKLMRKIDPGSIQEAFDEIDRGRQHDAFLFKQAESWRNDILEGNDNILEHIFNNYKDADRQKLRQLSRNARKEIAKGRHGKSFRSLFQYLIEIVKSGK